jgi:hypothetical protein
VNGQAVIPCNGMLAAACSSTSCRGSGHRRFLASAICASVRSATSERNIDVYADAGRRLPVADPAGRELMISCGAAVFTLRVAMRYLGSLPHVRLFPDSLPPRAGGPGVLG